MPFYGQAISDGLVLGNKSCSFETMKLQLGSSLLSAIIPGLFRLGPDIEVAKTQHIKVAVPISIPVDLRPWFNNRAVGADGNFDHHNRHYWASELLPTGSVKIGTVEVGYLLLFLWPWPHYRDIALVHSSFHMGWVSGQCNCRWPDIGRPVWGSLCQGDANPLCRRLHRWCDGPYHSYTIS